MEEQGTLHTQRLHQEADSLTKLGEEKRKAAFRKKRRKKIIKWSVLSLVLLLMVAGISYWVYQLFFVEEVIPDQTAVAYRGPFTSAISGYGQVKANKTETVGVKARGELLEVFVIEGAAVVAGDPLYRVDDSLLRATIDDAEKEKASLQTSLDEVYRKIAKLEIVAPFSGKLLEPKVKVGDMISEGTALAKIVDDSKMRLKLYFSYGYEDLIRIGQSVQISIPSTFSLVDGKVDKIDKVRKVTPEGTVLFAVEILMKNPGALAEGMQATAVLKAQDGSDITPAEAGVLEYGHSEQIFAEAGGRIVSLDMLEYSDYKQGALLCRLEGTSYQDSIDSLNEQIKLKQETIDGHYEQLAAFNATAPISGTVMGITAQPGKMLEAGEIVLTISDTSSMTAEVSVDERNIYNMQVGMPAELRQDTAEGSTSYFGTVKEVSLVAKFDYGYATYPAIIAVEGGEGLYPGSSIFYNIVINSKEDCLLLPIQAVKYTESGTCVFVKSEQPPEGVVELAEGVVPEGYYAVQVVTGLGDTSVIEIVEGIQEGTEVYLQPGISEDQNGPGIKVG